VTETAERLGRIEVGVTGDANARRIVLLGRLDETVPLGERAGAWAARTVTIDTAGVTFINSIGVREWMRLLRGLADRGASIRLERCAEVIIEQINMIDDAGAGAEVVSFHAPYACDHCGLETSVLLDVAKDGAVMRSMKTPPATCPECGGAMELYEVPEKFFLFLTVDAG
jgi:hypothetical protein